jgi:hypothetical protein
MFRRVYIGDAPAGGFPDPAGSTYSADTTLLGHGEDVLDFHLNRALYALHSSLDSIFEREFVIPKVVSRPAGVMPASSQIDLLNDGYGPPSNDLLVYLGPPGSVAGSAFLRINVLSGADGSVLTRIRDSASLEPIEVTDVLSSALGVTLYPLNLHLAGGPNYYPQPAAKMGQISLITPPNQIDILSTEGGPDTVALPMVGTCLINYSLMTRIAQGGGEDFHKAFAIVTAHVMPLSATVNRDISPAGANWQPNDVVYFTTVAYGPTLGLSSTYAQGPQDSVHSGGWTRVGDGDPDRLVRAVVVPTLAQPDRTPTIESVVPATIAHFGWDGWQAVFRAGIDLVRSTTGFMAIDGDEIIGSSNQQAFAAFLHGIAPFWGPIIYADETRLDDDPFNNPVTVAADMVTLTGVGSRFGQVVGHPGPLTYTTDIIKMVDLLEIWTGPGNPERLGVWLLSTPADPGVDGDVVTFSVKNLDKTAPTDLPGAGFARIVRLLFRSGTPTASALTPALENFTLVGHKGTAPGAATSVLDLIDGVADRLIRGWQRQTDGSLKLGFGVEANGDMFTIGSISAGTTIAAGGDISLPAANNFKYKTAKTFYHHVPLVAGHAGRYGGSDSSWKLIMDSARWTLDKAGAADDWDAVLFPVNLPDGVTMTQLAIQYKIAADNPLGPNPAIIELYKKVRTAPEWVTGSHLYPTLTLITSIVMRTAPAVGDLWTYTKALAEVVDSELNEYFIKVRGDKDGDNSDEIWGIRFDFTMINVKPA